MADHSFVFFQTPLRNFGSGLGLEKYLAPIIYSELFFAKMV